MKPGSEPLSSGPLNRRQFVCGTAASAAALVFSGCLLALGLAFGPGTPRRLGGLARFQDAGPTAKCGGVVPKALRLAAGLILDSV